jgi:hypothetical protein
VKRHQPDTGATVAALAARLDALDHLGAAIATHTGDINALARAVADLSAQVRTQTQTTARAIRDTGTETQDPDGGSDAGPAPVGQPDWLTVCDPVAAAGWLVDAHAFIDDVLAPLDAAPPAACWPLHPDVVVEVLSLHATYRAAYTNQDPTPVAEWLARWLPGATTRIHDALAACTAERGHRRGGATYHVPRLDPLRVATWWTDTHGTDPDEIEAFALTPLT